MYLIVDKLDKDYSEYKLCYIDEIPQEEYDYTPETKEYIKTERYKEWKDKYGYSVSDPLVEMKNYPNPEYEPGKREYYAYFSPVSRMGEIVGDDHDDRCYSCNAGIPYDTVRNEEVTVIKIPFALPDSGFWRGDYEVDIKSPKDWFYGNDTPWSAEDINLGAVPWLFARTCLYKYGNIGISIMAGITPELFLDKLEEIKGLVLDSLTKSKFIVLGKNDDGNWIVRNEDSYVIKAFNDKGIQQSLGWETDSYGYGERSRYQVFESYDEGRFEFNLGEAPDTLINDIINNYLK